MRTRAPQMIHTRLGGLWFDIVVEGMCEGSATVGGSMGVAGGAGCVLVGGLTSAETECFADSSQGKAESASECAQSAAIYQRALSHCSWIRSWGGRPALVKHPWSNCFESCLVTGCDQCLISSASWIPTHEHKIKYLLPPDGSPLLATY